MKKRTCMRSSRKACIHIFDTGIKYFKYVYKVKFVVISFISDIFFSTASEKTVFLGTETSKRRLNLGLQVNLN